MKTIFSQILRRADFDEEDGFFDLGGDSILAIALLNEIEKLTGRLLPVTSLYEASSVSALACLLTKSDKPTFSSLTLLKSGNLENPLFMIPGIAGTVMELRELARLIDVEQAIYGLEAAGVDGARPPFDNVEDLAQFHIKNIVAIQSNGPYYLAGYSFGGLVALEMALILSEAGKSVALVALIDTFPHVNFWPLWCRLAGVGAIIRTGFFKIPWVTVVRYYVSTARSLPFRSAIWFIVTRAWRAICFPFNPVQLAFWINRYHATGHRDSGEIAQGELLPVNLKNVVIASSKAFKYYKPKHYPFEVTFIKAYGTKFFDPNQFWKGLCAKSAVRVVKGDHHSIVKQNPGPVAIVLTTCIKMACERGNTS